MRKKTIREIYTLFSDMFETIKKLSELKDMGIISQEEFDAKKAELLSKI